ncbi:MAG: arylsulfatase A-like enzyme [Marinoscillum sp.]|jgi:arylsulfatase A-like enzyme
MNLVLIIIGWCSACYGMAQPNVIFILADDLGFGELGSYGAKDVDTPALDQLASGGVQFNRAYANSTVCSPSRAAILFGDYPDRVGVPGVIRDIPHNTWGNLRDDLVSMPDQFQTLGYQTALIGKWHLGYKSPDLPNDRGFDHFKGFVGDMMDDYYTHLRGEINWMRENEAEIDPEGHATDLFTEWTLDFISERKDSTKPFFLFLAYNAPHDPVQPPDDFLKRVQDRLPDVSTKRQKMIAMVEHLDQNVGKLIHQLKETGEYDQTLIVFTSDNGGALNHGANNAPFNGGKGDMMEGGIRIPCIMSWPQKLTASVTNEPFLLMDFYRLLPVLACKPSSELVNLSDALITTKRDDMIWVRREGHKFGGQAYYAISDGTHKYLQNSPFEPFALYNLTQDPMEQEPLVDKEKEKELLKKLTEHIQQSGKIPWQ